MHTIEQAITAIKKGELVILVDDEDRENEGDLILAADHVTPEAINFMAKHGRGLVCLTLANEIVDRLALPMMPSRNQSPLGTAFTVSIEARTGVTTGISAADRARTIKVATNPKSTPQDLVMPGHIFPLRARDGGVLARRGQTEGSVDLAKLAGLSPAGVICEIMNDDGTMMRLPELKKFAKKHKLVLVSVEALARYRMRTENHLEAVAKASLPVELASGKTSRFTVIGYKNKIDGSEHLAIVKTKPGSDLPKKNTLVRVHSECLTGDAFGSKRCDCGPQLREALEQIHREGEGAIVYLRSHEGRGIGLVNKIKAYALQDKGLDTVEANRALGFKADQRSYASAARILSDLGVKSARLLTNNPAKIEELKEFGITVSKRVPIEMKPESQNANYLTVKRDRMGHLLSGLHGLEAHKEKALR